MISAIVKEIKFRKNYLSDNYISSVYFGGGTPSMLDEKDLGLIFDVLSKYFQWDKKAEITLEANPDDLDRDKVHMFQKLGVNRLSIGVQSFFDEDLVWMNRAHNSTEAKSAVKLSQDAGLDNISIDLIYGSPTTSDDMWLSNINCAIALGIPHISSYCLTVEEKTTLHHQVKTGKSAAPNPEKAIVQFGQLMKILDQNSFEHYEISNFAKPGHYALHNTNYWRGVPYLGIGPSAHSFDGPTRSWNISHNQKYIDALTHEKLPLETEVLSTSSRYNEYIMTGLRTIWGIDKLIIQKLGNEFSAYFLKQIKHFIDNEDVINIGNQYILSQKGKYFADRIAMVLFYID
jgi:oxygen-independent coproporphyrinogen-3 oxidase